MLIARRIFRLGFALPLLVLAANACNGGDDLIAPGTNGTLEVTTITSGAEQDSDGYTVQVDGAPAQAIESSGTLTLGDLAAGDHSVQLAGLAANCSVTGDNPRTASVTAEATTGVVFEITCGATTGGLSVTSATTGPDLDADGYTVSVDGIDRGALGVNATVAISGLAPGTHAVGLNGVAANCQINGENVRSIVVVAGEDASVSYAITCTTPPAGAGNLSITTVTTGAADPDGYTFAVDGGLATPIGSSATVTIQNLAPGSHNLQLGGINSNCSVQGTNPRPVTITGGATAEVSFTVSCAPGAPTSGSIKVTTATSGATPDADGYTVSVDGGSPRPIGVNQSVTLENVPAGDRSVALAGVAENCTVAGANPRLVTVAASAQATVTFTVTCPSTGEISWSMIDLPGGFTGRGLWAASATDIYVAGSSSSGGAILHYDGQDWASQSMPDNGNPSAVWGSGPNDVYAAGGERVWRNTGSGWVTAWAEGNSDELTLLGGSSAQNVFAAGYHNTAKSSTGLILTYNGTGWTREEPIPDMGTINDVSGLTSADGWAVGTQLAPFQPEPGELAAEQEVWHFDGSTWTENHVIGTLLGEPGGELLGIWPVASNDVFMVGTQGRIFRYDGSDWTPMTSPTSVNLVDVWGTSGSDVFAVGSGGILRFDGSTWKVIDERAGTRVWGAGRDVFVLTEGGVLHGTR
jgi:hypothetical protein